MKIRTAFLLLALFFIAIRAEDDVQVEEDEDEGVSGSSSETAEPVKKELYKAPDIPPNSFMAETFDGLAAKVLERWVKSTAKKSSGERYDGLWAVESALKSAMEGDVGLVIKTKARHHAIASKLSKPFDFSTAKQLVVQYEVRFTEGMECGGAYMKLLSKPLEPQNFFDKSPYTIMFGPDKCGNTQKLHVIIQFRNPLSGKLEEKHMKPIAQSSLDIAKLASDKRTHLFTLVLNVDNTFEVFVDMKRVKSGSLLAIDDFDPPLIPPKEIDDPKDKKPKDWDDRAKIPDPEAKKPDDWDEDEPEFITDENKVKPDDWLESEEKMIPDPSAEKPDDWEEDMDGEWEAPLIENPKCAGLSGCGKWEPEKIKNPKYRGKWSAPQIDNPNYQGVWKPRRIDNPNYFEETAPFTKLDPIDAVGFELWTMTEGIVFDNILISESKEQADKFAEQTWKIKQRNEGPDSRSAVTAIQEALAERPWLWIVVIVVVALPCAFFIAYCCYGGSSSSSPNEMAARKKKTDEATENDAIEDEEEEEDDDDEMPPLEAQDGDEEPAENEGARKRHK